MAATVTTIASVLKTLFPPKMSLEIMEKDPLFGLIKHRTDFGGKQRDVPILYGNNQGHGANFTKAAAVDHNDLYSHFAVTRSSYYGFVNVTREMVEASKSDAMGFINGIKDPIRNMMNSVGAEIQRMAYASYGGCIGRIAAGGIAAAVITLTNRTDTKYFYRGMRLELSTDDGTGAAPAGVRAGYVTVASVNHTAGTVTCTANVVAGIAAAVAGDYIFRYGNYGVCLHGLASQRPATDPTAGDSYWGVDRSVALDELCGVLVDLSTSTATMEGKLQDALAEASWRGAKEVTAGFMHTTRWHNTVKELGSRVVRDNSVKAKRSGIGYKSFVLTGPNGDVNFFPSPNVGADDVWMLAPEYMTFDKLGEAPAPIKDPFDGKVLYRSTTADSFEIRIGVLGEFHISKPNELVRVLM